VGGNNGRICLQLGFLENQIQKLRIKHIRSKEECRLLGRYAVWLL
jgi:hypothetical protein